MSIQRSHFETTFNKQTLPIILICDAVKSPANLGALFRICDAFGVQEVVLCNASVDMSSNRLKRVSRNTEKNVSYRFSDSISKITSEMKNDGFQLVALEITNNSVPLNELNLAKKSKIALIIGNEQNGVSKQFLDAAKQTIHIEMFGDNSSMNIAQATSITLYSISQQLVLEE